MIALRVDLEPHIAGLEAGKLQVSRCGHCRRPRFPPTSVCSHCLTVGGLEWFTAAGTGAIWSFAVFHKAYFPPPDPQPPYTVAVVQLTEGVMVISNVVGEDVRVGMAVHAVFERNNQLPVVRFRPVPV